MFAVVRTGGKQYRVAPGDKIVVEKLDGNAGDRITLGDVLLAGEGSDLKGTDGLTVAAEIIAQAKGEKVTVFKKRRRHNYRRKKGHRQQHTILRIVAIGDHKAEGGKKSAKADKAADSKPAPKSQGEEKPTANPAPSNPEQANPAGGAPAEKEQTGKTKAASAPAKAKADAAPKSDAKPAKSKSTENAAPAKGAAKKSPKAK